jgi:hypothetical protein
MGLGTSKETELDLDALLSSFGSDEQRVLLRNFQLLASRSQPHDAFRKMDWLDVHSAMAPQLAAALFDEFGGGSQELVALHDVARTLARARHSPAALACASGALQRERLAADALAWLRRSDVPLQHLTAPEALASSIIGAAVMASWLLDHRAIQPLPHLSDAAASLTLRQKSHTYTHTISYNPYNTSSPHSPSSPSNPSNPNNAFRPNLLLLFIFSAPRSCHRQRSAHCAAH